MKFPTFRFKLRINNPRISRRWSRKWRVPIANGYLLFQLFCLQDDTARRESSPEEASAETRTRRSDPSHSGNDWQLDEALKRTRNATMLTLLSDSDHNSDVEKPARQAVEESRSQAEKPKPQDVRKRGRPRKSTKSPKSHRTPSEDPKGSGKTRSRPRVVASPKKKTPISKPTVDTSDDASDARYASEPSLTLVCAVREKYGGIIERKSFHYHAFFFNLSHSDLKQLTIFHVKMNRYLIVILAITNCY